MSKQEPIVREQHDCDYCGKAPYVGNLGPVTRDASENWMHDSCRKKFLGI